MSAPDTLRDDLLPGRVVQNQRGHLKIRTSDGVVDARAAGRRFHAAGEDGLLPVVGDWVAVRAATGSDAVAAAQVHNRLAARANTSAFGKLDANASFTRLTETVMRAPSFATASRSPPRAALRCRS